VQKQEQNIYKSKWKEYTLYSRKSGYAFLSEYDGHWIFVKEELNVPVLLLDNDTSFTYGNETFKLFNKYEYKLIDSAGEFPYNIFDDENTCTAYEYINPPAMWIKEQSKSEGTNWFIAEHIPKRTVEKAFNVSLPYKKGIGAVQPSGFKSSNRFFAVTGFLLYWQLLFTCLLLMVLKRK